MWPLTGKISERMFKRTYSLNDKRTKKLAHLIDEMGLDAIKRDKRTQNSIASIIEDAKESLEQDINTYTSKKDQESLKKIILSVQDLISSIGDQDAYLKKGASLGKERRSYYCDEILKGILPRNAAREYTRGLNNISQSIESMIEAAPYKQTQKGERAYRIFGNNATESQKDDLVKLCTKEFSTANEAKKDLDSYCDSLFTYLQKTAGIEATAKGTPEEYVELLRGRHYEKGELITLFSLYKAAGYSKDTTEQVKRKREVAQDISRITHTKLPTAYDDNEYTQYVSRIEQLMKGKPGKHTLRALRTYGAAKQLSESLESSPHYHTKPGLIERLRKKKSVRYGLLGLGILAAGVGVYGVSNSTCDGPIHNSQTLNTYDTGLTIDKNTADISENKMVPDDESSDYMDSRLSSEMYVNNESVLTITMPEGGSLYDFSRSIDVPEKQIPAFVKEVVGTQEQLSSDKHYVSRISQDTMKAVGGKILQGKDGIPGDNVLAGDRVHVPMSLIKKYVVGAKQS